MINKLHFISNQTPAFDHLDSISLALRGGCKLIQLRVKNASFEVLLDMAHHAKTVCDEFDAKLVINDYPDIAREVEAYGLHLGLDDMPVAQARAIVGNDIIIGGTANTWEHVLLRISEGVDYVGIGPLRFTNTKKNLSPILGFEGYAEIIEKMKQHKLHIPLIVIGGVDKADISRLKEIGIHGVAISGAITDSDNPAQLISFINNTLC